MQTHVQTLWSKWERTSEIVQTFVEILGRSPCPGLHEVGRHVQNCVQTLCKNCAEMGQAPNLCVSFCGTSGTCSLTFEAWDSACRLREKLCVKTGRKWDTKLLGGGRGCADYVQNFV